MPKYLEVGKIVNTHGVRGEVRVQSVTDFPEVRYANGSKLVVRMDHNEYVDVVVASHRVHKSFDLLTFEDYSSMNDVIPFKTKLLMVDEMLIPELEDNEYYANEIMGAEIVDEENSVIGILKEILYLPANDVWVVSRKGKKDLLLPYIESVILDVDMETKKVMVHVLEGLDPDEN